MAEVGQGKDRNIKVKIERQALRDVLASLSRPGGENEWCVACGAGAASSKLDYPADLVDKVGQQLLEPEALRAFVASIKDVEEQDWCVACGAGVAAAPFGQIVNPADIPDALIDEMSEKLIGAVKIG